MLHNISRIKDDYIIKFGQLIEYNIEHLKNRTQNVMKKSCRLIYKKSALIKSLDQQSEMLKN